MLSEHVTRNACFRLLFGFKKMFIILFCQFESFFLFFFMSYKLKLSYIVPAFECTGRKESVAPWTNVPGVLID